jgi:hypothetical protein
VDFPHRFDRLSGSVGGNGNVGIEHGDERLEVAGEWVDSSEGKAWLKEHAVAQ